VNCPLSKPPCFNGETRGGDGTGAPSVGDRIRSTTTVSAQGKDPASAIWVVVDDFLDIVPVTRAELDVIEVYLADLIDESLGGNLPRK
jgi:hypothetical protein